MGDGMHPFNTSNDYGDGSFENTIMIEETVVWEQNETLNESNFDEKHDTSNMKSEIIEENEGYMTADDYDQTQYFSILESTVSEESVLPDIHIALDTSKAPADDSGGDLSVNSFIDGTQQTSIELTIQNQNIDDSDLALNNVTSSDDVFLYKMEGTDDIYAVQTADDGNGNLQRYQFKVRTNSLGQYEAVPGTIEVQSEDSPLAQAISQVQSNQWPMEQEDVKEEKLPDMCTEEMPTVSEYLEHEEESNDLLIVNEDEPQDESHNKHGIIEQHKAQYEQIYLTENVIETNEDSNACYDEDNMKDVGDCQQSQHGVITDDKITTDNSSHYDTDEEQIEYLEEAFQENECDDDYQTVEGLHITGDSEEDVETKEIDTEKIQLHTMQLVDAVQTKNEDASNAEDELKANGLGHVFKNEKHLSYFIIRSPSSTLLSKHALKPLNPRSLLKTTYTTKLVESVDQPIYEGIIEDGDNELPQIFTTEFPTVKMPAPKANILNKICPKPVVVHTPVRQIRQPRKQTITPVERVDSEIIVQEVTFAGNNILTAGNVRTPKASSDEIYQVSDSDEDYTPQKQSFKKKNRKPKRKSRSIAITISDSDEDDTDESVIEVHLADDDSDEDIDKENIGTTRKRRMIQNKSTTDIKCSDEKSDLDAEETAMSPPKRRRGRPPKLSKTINTSIEIIDIDKDGNNKTNDEKKTSFSETDDGTKLSGKNLIPCKKCPKSFARESSLKMHMQFHQTRKLKSDRSTSESSMCSEDTNIVQNAFKCKHCKESFQTKFLLVKHEDTHKRIESFKCTVCKKSFSTTILLNSHYRVHMKESLIRNTSACKLSPKKTKPQQTRKSEYKFKSPKKVPAFKCENCSKICTTSSALEVHKRVHKTFPCKNCKKTFNSNILLEKHVRENCVKKSPKKSTSTVRPSFVTRRQSLGGKISRISTALSTTSKVADVKSTPNIVCTVCKDKFNTHTALYRHKRDVHDRTTTLLRSAKKRSGKNTGVPIVLKRPTRLNVSRKNDESS